MPAADDPNPTPSVPTGRLAPSPTGGLHAGHARTFLAAWLAARGSGGSVVLRVEDLDAARARPEATASAVADLRWLGLDWDAGPWLQSDRRASYQSALDGLIAGERVYPCTCTRADVARAASAPHAEDEGPRYPGTCAGRRAADAGSLAAHPFAWRFRVAPGAVSWDDLVAGPSAVDPSRAGGDFVVGRSTGEISYQLAVVVDDAAMGVTQVIRGCDLVPSTPRQILLFRTLGLPEPAFGHLPLVVGAAGTRLAKRDGSIKLASLRGSGVDPRRLTAVLAASLGIEGVPDRCTPAELVGRLDLGRVPDRPFVFRTEDLGAPGDGQGPAESAGLASLE